MNEKGFKSEKEWFEQAEYDIKSADIMFKGGRYIYSVFLCHLCIEKALKGIFVKRFKKNPPKTHNLLYFLNALEIESDKEQSSVIMKLNEASIPTRYPEDLKGMIKDFSRVNTKKILADSKGILKWLKIK
ncbi:MAG TPA: HEPN domain-containing protein [Candidatus Goldiibacteriota bacterium]|jgi:HEPN domain-containing protein|nr:HEPN domain-containing protein [Candidatus Goldiibacteriota bacterium]HPI04411.1 HEPN domain-containing protein [Candidatus Goldiibacteriota bacterium]HPN65315.1 HEPN domain-containing protein [Candidatus Goldiibacteriota bacterium]HRQ45008.1 HEPN domain-containing protein [Candidatus Goldiibacteriota bacterium]